MSADGEVLIAIMNNPLDFAIAQGRHWYRVPVSSAEKWLKGRWPPQWLAFYQTKPFGEEAYAINYWAEMLDQRQVARWQMFPDQPCGERAIGGVGRSSWGGCSGCPHRYSVDVDEGLSSFPLPGGSSTVPLRSTASMTRAPWRTCCGLSSNDGECGPSGKNSLRWVTVTTFWILPPIVDVETDGDTWHAHPEKAAQDNRGDNALKVVGWRVLRFTSPRNREELSDDCLRTVVDTVNNLGGVDEGKLLPPRIDPGGPGSANQLGLFDNL